MAYPNPAPQPTAYRTPASALAAPRQFVLHLDPDLLPLCEDQAQSMGLSLAAWVDKMAGEALRGMLGA